MQKFFLILFFILSLNATAQTDTIELKEAMSQLDNALINKEEKVLEKILHDELSFGHSTGWAQTKEQVFEDFRSGKLVYLKFDNSSASIVALTHQYATVRINTNAEGTLNGNPFDLKMHVLQVWIKMKTGWQLLARQSAAVLRQESKHKFINGFYKIYEEGELGSTLKIFCNEEKKIYEIDSLPAITIHRIKEANIDSNGFSGKSEIHITLDDFGSRQFERLTIEAQGKKIALIVDDEIIIAATVFEPIFGGKLSYASAKSNNELQLIVMKLKESKDKKE